MAISIPIIAEWQGGNALTKASQEFKQLEGVGKKAAFAIRKAAIPATASLAIMAKTMGDAVKAASDLGESINAVNVTFGDSADEILKLSDAAAETVGLSKKDFNGLAVQFASFATKIAGKGGDVVDVLKKITGRAADFASVFNIDVADAAAKFQSGLAGEAEPLKKFGIDLSNSAIEAFALANKIGVVTKKGVELTEAEKVLARYGALMEQTQKTAGDFANTSDSFANKQRILTEKMENFKATLGEALLPVLQNVLPYVEKFADWAAQNPGTFQAIAAAITAVSIAIIAVNAAMALNPFSAIAAGIALLVTGLAIAYKKFEGFREVVNTVANFVLGYFEFIINGWIAVINTIIRGYNKIPGLPDIGTLNAVTLPRIRSGGPDTEGLSTSRVTALASGGIVMSPTLAIVGEGGEPEAVIPLSKLAQMGYGGNGVNITVQTGVGDPVAIGREVAKVMDAYLRRSGRAA